MNKTTTFLVGNGIGMALNPAHFAIIRGLDVAWEATSSRDIKSIIYHSLGKKRRPRNEIDLQTVQQYFFELQYIEEQIRDLPPQIKRKFGKIHQISEPYFGYLFEVAKHFFNYKLDCTSPNIKEAFDKFVANFSEWIVTNKRQGHTNHIVTLNYDALLFRGFYQNNLFGRLNETHFVDGITKVGYDPDIMRPKGNNHFGWFIHLHCSPLFYTKEGCIYKDTYNTTHSAFDDIGDYIRGREHVILCHPIQKYERIKHSLILSSYFDFFEEAVRDACTIVLFGYEGGNHHINKIIARFPEKKIIIVEWSGLMNTHQEPLGEYENQRRRFWRDQLKRNDKTNLNGITLHHIDSVLNFDFSLLNN